ncbi:MAG: hypothetical protein A3F84_21800 [Candidatus Handelsmanbacteria bacterium RIFCSPLOWO2_12_FULL_64_10]|uniref:Lipid/polyisoprenoid-binding YceI-like domain-containing protein n=1 Tax=Handelsmanbacteria sp. (strain RIFCSPLOWO2_12_FULL_64_10) TaxID=1817868 RepID=A0A1F6D0B6_HANXR|nr:MAG: hypothetical protein A3F84_21800 [Candidatus Handelsmanbacteria bacterium RIFCSPLOWO2_12_FULL_64_10]
MKRILIVMTMWAVALAARPALAGPATFHVNDKMGRNVVKFESHAPLETIIGTTNQVVGEIQVDPDNITASPKVSFEVDLASIDTGIQLRNQHMREQYLNTAKYPKITFALDRVDKASQSKLAGGQVIDIDGVGTFTLHGVTRQEPVHVRATYLKESADTRLKMPGNLLRVAASFNLKLSDYKIPIPQMVILKLDENIKVDVDAFATDAAPGMAGMNPCNPCGGKAANPCNPCGGKKAANPCNPCGKKKMENPCNPCGGKKKAENPCNPCSKKKAANPCNPCGKKK